MCTVKTAINRILILIFIAAASINQCFAKTFTIGKITNNPAKHSRYIEPYADYLLDQLESYGYTQTEIIYARSIEELANLIRQNKVDMLSETAFAYFELNRLTDVEPIALRWKKGVRDYHSVFFVKADSNIKTLKDVKDSVVTFEDPSSTSGFAIPAAMLLQQGAKLQRLYSPREEPNAGKIGYIFSGTEETTATWVYKGLSDVGAMSSTEWSKARRFLAEASTDLTVIAESPIMPRALEIVNAKLAPNVKLALEQILCNMHENRIGLLAMQNYQKTALFEPISAEILENLKKVEKLSILVRQEGL